MIKPLISALSLLCVLANVCAASVRGRHPSESKYLYAVRLLYEGHLDEAIRDYKTIIDRDPTFYKAYEKLLMASKRKQSVSELAAYFETLYEKNPKNPYVNYGLGLYYMAKKEYDRALTSLQNAIALGPQFEEPYKRIVEVYKSRGDLDAAVGYFKERMRKDPKGSNAHLGMGYYYKIKKELDYALDSLNKATERNQRNLSAAQIKSQIYWSTKKHRSYLVACQQIDKLAEERDDFEQVMENYMRLGHGYMLFKDRLRALQYLESSLEMADRISNQRSKASALYRLGILYSTWKKPYEGLKYFEESVRLSRRTDDKATEAASLLGRGDAYKGLENFSKAKESYIEALKVCTATDDEARMAYGYCQLGSIHSVFGDYDKAIDLYKKGLFLAKDIANEEHILLSLGEAYNHQGQYDLALEHFRKALRLAGKKENSKATLLNLELGGIGIAYLGTGDWNLALDYLTKALAAAKRSQARDKVGLWSEKIGEVNFKLGRYDEARRAYSLALKIGLEMGYADITRQAYQGLGSVMEVRNQYADAFAYYQKAVYVLEDIKKRLPLVTEQTHFIEDKTDIYGKIVDLLIRMHRQDPAGGYLEQAFAFCQKAKTQSLRNLLWESHIFSNLEEIPAELRQKVSETQDTLNLKHLALAEKRAQRVELNVSDRKGQQLLESLKDDVADFEDEVDRLEKEKAVLLSQVKVNFPNYAKLAEPEVLTSERIQKEVLRDHEVLIEYLVSKEKTIAFFVSKRAFSCERLPIARGERVGDNGSENLKHLLAAISPIFNRSSEIKNKPRTAQWANIQLSRLHKLYGLLFQPLEPHLEPESDLTIVPDDLLGYLPFEMLVTEFNTQRIKYLAEQHPISYVYSSSLLGLPAAARKEKHQPPLDLLAIGNPDFGKNPTHSFTWLRKVLTPLGSFVRGSHSFAQLPYAEIEVTNISKIIKNSQVFIGEAATEKAFKSKAAQSRILHLATHNEIDPVNYFYSRILFALNPKINQQGEDGSLYTYEIFNLKLNADLVVLNGCETGVGRLQHKEGLEAISRAFMYAGAPSLIANLWPIVDGEAAVHLSENFYRHLANGMDKRRALQKAKLDVITEGKYDDPFYWAPSILIGDPSPVPVKRSSAFPFSLLLVLIVLAGSLLSGFVKRVVRAPGAKESVAYNTVSYLSPNPRRKAL